MGGVKVQGHIVHPVSNPCTFSFHINRTTHSCDMSLTVKKHIQNFQRKFDKKKFPTEFLQNLHDLIR